MMNDGNHLENEALPPELSALAADLDRLAAHDASSADASLADRIFLKTRSAVLHEGMTPAVRKVSDGMAEVAAHERRAIDAGFEQRVFDATVHHLHQSEPPAVLATIGTRRWVGRFAVAAGLAIAAVGAWMAFNWPVSPATTGNGDIAINTDNPSTLVQPNTPQPATITRETHSIEPKAASSELELVLASTEAEDSFVALFAIGDDLRSDIKAVATEAERVEKALGGEQSTGV